MKVLLILPPALEIAYGKYREAAKLGAQPQTPLGICYIAAVLEKAGNEVKLVDSDIEGLSLSGLLDVIREYKPEVIGLTATTPVYSVANSLLIAIKNNFPEIITILGGFHITALPVQTMKECTAIDYGVYGEGEETIKELVKSIQNKKTVDKIKGILWRNDAEIIMNHPRPLIKDLDKLPFPARHLLKMDKYVWSVPGKKMQPMASMITQRGCPYQCIFCGVHTMFKSVRFRSVKNIVDEVEYIVKTLGIDYINFLDDTLTLNREKVIEMCKEFEKRNLKLTWEGATRANLVDKELLTIMKSAGLVRLSIGVESGSQKILDAIKKGVTLEQMEQAYKWCYELGLETKCSFMIGHPFETKETIQETIDFAKKLKCYQAYINITTPFPGSELYELAKEGYGGLKLLTEDWSQYMRYGNSVLEMNDLTKEDLIKAQKRAYKKFYLRPHIILYNLKRAGIKAAVKNSVAFFKSIF